MLYLENNTAPATTAPAAVAVAKPLTYETLPKHLKDLAADRKGWEQDELLRSNERLYSILLGCYETVWAMNGVSSAQKAMKEAFKTYCEKHSYNFNASTHLASRVVAVVFGNIDRRRTSAYGIALKHLLLDGVSPTNFVAKVKAIGGIEEVRRLGAKAKATTTDRAKIGEAALAGPVLGSVSSDSLTKKFDSTFSSETVILIATYEADGSFAVRRLVQKDSVVKAALASIASAVEEEQKAAQQTANIQSSDEKREEAINEAVLKAA